MGVPTEEKKRQYKSAASVGRSLKSMYDKTQQVPEEGVTHLATVTPMPSNEDTEVWDKKTQRYKYRPGVPIKDKNGKSVGGRFVIAPPDAPARRKKGYRKNFDKKRRP